MEKKMKMTKTTEEKKEMLEMLEKTEMKVERQKEMEISTVTAQQP